jgi:hypothetical protein
MDRHPGRGASVIGLLGHRRQVTRVPGRKNRLRPTLYP